MSDTTNSAIIDIPIAGYDVAVDLLNDEYDDVEKLLVDEKVPLEHYIKTAVSYFSVDKIDYFQKLLNLIIEDPTVEEKYYHDQKTLLDARTDALNILAGHLIEQYNKVRIDQFGNERQAMEDLCDNKREELLNDINRLLGRAEQFNPSKLSNFLSRGVLHLNLGALDKAESQFDYILTVDKDNVLSRLGMACIKYHKKQYKEALGDFEKCLRMNPQGPADIRLGMGLCHYQLDNFERAKQCFERVLHLDPNNVSALIFLAIIGLNSRDEGLLQNAVKNHLARAYALDSGNSQVLNMLGNHFFFRREVDRTEHLVFSAFHNTKSPKIKAESCYNMARAYHLRKDYDSAFKYYYRIVSRLWPEYTLARYGLGQLYIQRNEFDKAIEEFEQILKVDPENLETNLALGNLYAKKRDSKKCLTYLKKVLKRDPENINALLRIGEHERYSIKHALDSLKQALSFIEEGETELVVTHELYNNIAVHYYKLGSNIEAEEYFKKALSLAECSVLDNLDNLQQAIDVKHLSLIYNFARFKEATKSYEVAEKLYLKIAAQHPSYINAYLRLGKIQQRNGNQEKAIHFCKLATSLEPNNAATWAFLGQTHLEQNNYTDAQKAFEYITQNIDKNDIYALLGMGNVYFRSLRVTKSTSDEKEQERIEKHLDYALLFFEKTLKLDNSNLFAALNSGCVLCENGYTEEGKALISRVREVCVGDEMKDTPETYINLGHLAMIQKQYAQAEKLYSTCSKRFFNDENSLILAYMAKALFDSNKHEESLKILKKIQEKDITNLTIKYNIALSFYEKMVTTLNESNKDLSKVHLLEDQLQSIINLFSEIAENTTAKKNICEFSLPENVVVHKAKEYITVLETKVKEKIEKYRERAEREEFAKQELKKKQEDAFKTIEEQTKKQLEDQEEIRRAKEEKLRETFGRLESIKANLKTTAFEDDEEDEKKTKKRKKHQDLDEEYPTESTENAEEAPVKKKRKPKEPKKNKEKKEKKETKKKSRLKKNSTAPEEEERDDFEVDDIPQASAARVVNDDNDNDEDDYMEEGPSRATADGEEEFEFDKE